MITTLLKLGEQLSVGRDEWDDVLDFIDPSKGEKTNAESTAPKKEYLIIDIIFDLDQNEVCLGDRSEFDIDDSVRNLKHIKTLGGHNKAMYFTAESKKIHQIYKTFFGDLKYASPDSETKSEFIEHINNKNFDNLKDSQLVKAIENSYSLKLSFLELFKDTKEEGEIKFGNAEVLKRLELSKNASIFLFTVSYRCSEQGFPDATLFTQLDGFDQFIQLNFLDKKKIKEGGEDKLSYLTGEFENGVTETMFSERYNLNKVFITDKINYASNFSDFTKNYQLTPQQSAFLDRASGFLLENYKINIAGVTHVIVPQFMDSSDFDYKKALIGLKGKSELLFAPQEYSDFTDRIKRRVSDIKENKKPYWLNYFAFDSDGNFFKIMNFIKDISQPYLDQVLDIFINTGIRFKGWLGQKYIFNLQSVYWLIPQREKDKFKNEALSLFACIFERRKIESARIFGHFCSLIQCHYFNRYGGYKNIRENNNFDFAIKDAVFGYMAFLKSLEKLQLLKENIFMEENEQTASSENSYGEQVENFFKGMGYTDAQKALFYLGRVLNSIAYAQSNQGHDKKPVMAKLNYNGMDKDSIIRLRNDLSEKAKQYGIIGKTDFNFSKFTSYFNPNVWAMKPEEALFFILSGYSFGIKTSEQ